jgi:hypothetical protein
MTRVLVATVFVLMTSTHVGAQTTRNELTDALVRLELAVQALGPDRPA